MQKKPKITYSFINIMTGSDLSQRRLPFMAAESGRKGPVLFLTACCHGDEVGGIVIIQEIFKKIKKERLPLKGSIFAFPLMNPIGFETRSRHITFTKEDLNRSFPGNSKGSLGERIADIIFTTIRKTRPTLVIDLHNDWIRSIPYALIEKDPGPTHAEAYRFAEKSAMQSGFVQIRDTETLTTTLTHSLLQIDIPAFTLEMGESHVVNEKNIEDGFHSLLNVMAGLGICPDQETRFQYPLPDSIKGVILDYHEKPYSSKSGVMRFMTEPGKLVKHGRPVAKVYNTFGRLRETITTEVDGIVLGHVDTSVSFPGMPVMAFGAFKI